MISETQQREAADLAHAQSVTAHEAQQITYDGTVVAGNVKLAIDSVQKTIDQLVVEGDSGPEAAAARYSTPFDENYATLKGRLDKADQRWINRRVFNVLEYGAYGYGTHDDTNAIQSAIDAAVDVGWSGELDNKPVVLIPNGIYRVTGLVIPRGLTISGSATLQVIGQGNTGIQLLGALYCIIKGLKILLTEEGQVGIELSENSQLNTFKNLWIEGGFIKDTTAIKIGRSWVNSFHDCKFFRTADGVSFLDPDSNANFFYGCEIRSNLSDPNSKMAVLHINGKKQCIHWRGN